MQRAINSILPPGTRVRSLLASVMFVTGALALMPGQRPALAASASQERSGSIQPTGTPSIAGEEQWGEDDEALLDALLERLRGILGTPTNPPQSNSAAVRLLHKVYFNAGLRSLTQAEIAQSLSDIAELRVLLARNPPTLTANDRTILLITINAMESQLLGYPV